MSKFTVVYKRFDKVYDCLSRVLGVEYEYAQEEIESPVADWSNLRVPGVLLERLKASAEIYDVSALESCLDELESLGAEGHALAGELRKLSRAYAIDRILEILGGL